MIVDWEDSRGISIAREKLRSGRAHGKRNAPSAGLVQDGGAKQIVADTERTEKQNAAGKAPAQKATGEPRSVGETVEPDGTHEAD